LQLKGVNATPLRIEKKTTQLDLLWEVVETEQGIVVVLEYNTDLFLDQTATRMLKNFEILLNQIVVKPRAKLAELIEILALTDKKQQIREIQQHKEEFKHKLKQAQRRVVNSTETVEIVE
jgi:non-ribosomal peptide synthetase component F